MLMNLFSTKKWLLAGFVFFTILILPNISNADISDSQILFFYSPTCPHCRDEQVFLDKLEDEFPDLAVERVSVNSSGSMDRLAPLLEQKDASNYLGVVPITFVGDELFIGFDNEKNIGKAMRESLLRQFGLSTKDEKSNIVVAGSVNQNINVPFVGNVGFSSLPLPVLTILLGFLDGFNVCSLGALLVILGLVITLKSRTKIFIYGGAFILTTAIVYGLLIVLWHQIFKTLSPYLRTLQIIIGLVGILGGVYFVKEFFRIKRQGMVCETSNNKLIKDVTRKIKEVFSSPGKSLTIVGSILVFSAIIAVVEFPCSAAVPLVFAGILADAGLPTFGYLGYIALFIVFYMIDEIIVFSVAVWKMNIWLSSPKFSKWVVLVEALVLFIIGFYYLGALFN